MKRVLSITVAFVLLLTVCSPVLMSSAAGFKDVAASYWAYDAISALAAKKVIAGYADGTFKPEASVTREEFAKMIVTAKGLAEVKPATPTFSDVPKTRWSYGVVEAAAKAGYIKGIGGGKFGPAAAIKRQDLAVLLVRVLGKEAAANAIAVPGTFSNDEAKISSYALKPVSFAVRPSAQLLVWDAQRNINPMLPATRADCAFSVYRVIAPPLPTTSITVALQQDPDSLFYPTMSSMAASGMVMAGVQDGLCVQAPTGALYPSMAMEVPTVANGLWKIDEAARTMVVTYRLRKGIKWSDGMPVTSHDFAFAQTMRKNTEINLAGSRYVDDMVDRIDDTDPYKVVVYWKDLYPLANWGQELLPAHILEPIFEKNPADINSCSFHQSPIFAGPYVVDAWERNGYIRLRANPNYWGGLPLTNTVKFEIIPNSTVILSHFIAGSVDVAAPGMAVESANQAEILRKQAGDRYAITVIPSIGWEHITVNLAKSQAGQDYRVRQALQYALNRDELNRKVFLGTRLIVDSWATPGGPQFNSSLGNYPYDLAKAEQLLTEAGWKLDASGRRLDKNGKPVTLVISSTTSPVRAQQFPVIQADWAKLGIVTEYKPISATTFFGDILPAGDYDMGLFTWTGNPADEGSAYGLFTTGSITWIDDQEGQNYSGISDPELDRVLEITANTLDPDIRNKAFRDAQAITFKLLPDIYLLRTTSIRVENRKMEGFDYPLDSGNISYTWNVSYWWRK
jgi:peptide/nickel transport system substrate-binding protein